MNLPLFVATCFGASLPGILLYAVVQRWVRKRPTTWSGYAVVTFGSLFVVMPQLRKDMVRDRATATQTTTLAALESGCTKQGVKPEDCRRLAGCVLSGMKSRYSND